MLNVCLVGGFDEGEGRGFGSFAPRKVVPPAKCRAQPDPSLGLLLESRKRLLSGGPSAPSLNAGTRPRADTYILRTVAAAAKI